MSNELIEGKQISESTSIVSGASSVVSLEDTIRNAEKYVAAMAKVRLLAIQLTNAMDWSDQGGKPYLEKSGCDKIASGFGMKSGTPTFEKETIKDDLGEYIQYTCSGDGWWNNVEGSEIGVCSTRDDFFGTRAGGFKPLSEVDLTDIKKKAFTNWANRLIKKLLGLTYTWEELKELSGGKIALDTVKKVQFAAGAKGGNADSPETKAKRQEIGKMLMDLNAGDPAAASKMLEEMTTFQGTNGPVKGKTKLEHLSEKQVPMVYGQLKKKIEAFNKELDKSSAQEEGPIGA